MKSLVLIVVGILIGICLFQLKRCYNYIFYSNIKVRKIHFDHWDFDLYLKQSVWGLTEDKKIISLSTNDKLEVDTTVKDDYSIYGLDHIFYQQKGDTLILFTSASFKNPEKFISPIKVKQVILTNPEIQDLYKKVGETPSIF